MRRAIGGVLLALAALALALAPWAARAQALVLRAGTVAPDTVWLLPGDTITLRVRGVSTAGGSVTPTGVTVVAAPDCHVRAGSGTTVQLLEQVPGPLPLECTAAIGWWTVEGTVRGVRVRDSVWVARPDFPMGSDRALCMTAAHASLRYASRDTTLVVALEGRDQRIPRTWSDPQMVSFGWHGGTRQLKHWAIACMPGFVTRDVTRSTLTRWVSRDTAVATVDGAGVATWRPRGPLWVDARWPVR